jgi:hypothetical protein
MDDILITINESMIRFDHVFSFGRRAFFFSVKRKKAHNLWAISSHKTYTFSRNTSYVAPPTCSARKLMAMLVNPARFSTIIA